MWRPAPASLTGKRARVIDSLVSKATPTSAAPVWQQRIYTERTAVWAGLLLVLAAALVYALTLDRWLTWGNLAGGDLITHQYAQVQARPSNAPGYPLYTMGGWLWFHGLRALAGAFGMPNPNPIPLLSSWSTLWALVALWLLYRATCLLTSTRHWPASPWRRAGNWPLAWLLSAFFAVTYFFWYYATTTEQYSSAVAQTLAIVYVYLLWAEADTGASAGYAVRSRAGGLLLAARLSLRHLVGAHAYGCLHRAAARRRHSLAAPGLAAQLADAGRRGRCSPRAACGLWFRLRAGFAAPGMVGRRAWSSAGEWFWAFVATSQGWDELGWGFEAGRAMWGNGFPALIWQELSIPMLLAGFTGIACFKRRTAVLLYGTLAIYLLFTWAYRYGNWFQVILPAYPLLLLGIAGWSLRIATWRGTARMRWLQPVLLVLIAGAVAWRFAASWPAADSSRYPADEALARASTLLGSDLPLNAALFAEQGDAASLDYLAQIWGLRPDLRVIGSSQAQAALAEGRPLVSTWATAPTLLEEMGGVHTVRPLNGDWAQIDGLAQDSAQLIAPPATAATGDLPVLESYATAAILPAVTITATQPAMDLRLRWRLPEGGWPEGLSLSIRPTLGGAFIPDPNGPEGAILQVDAAAPLRGLAASQPGTAWLDDAFRLPLAAPLPEGADGIALILYRARDGSFETRADMRLPLEPRE